MQAKWSIPLVRGNPPCMSFKEIAAKVALTVFELRVYAAQDADFPKPVSNQRTAYHNTYYSKPDAIRWVKKYLTARAG